jgi:hypothetical protein
MLFMVLMLMLAAGQVARPGAARAVTLKVPSGVPQGGSAWLEVALGLVERGAEVEVTTAAGRTIAFPLLCESAAAPHAAAQHSIQ